MFSLFAGEKPQPKAAEAAIQKISTISATQLSRFERLPQAQRYAIIGAASVGGLSLLWALTASSKSTRRPPIRSPRESLLPELSDEDAADLPYHPAALPGARDVNTPFGSIRVYEFGPRDGEKVLLIHGISTPSIALTDLAHKLVGRGRRVMLFGGSLSCCHWSLVCLFLTMSTLSSFPPSWNVLENVNVQIKRSICLATRQICRLIPHVIPWNDGSSFSPLLYPFRQGARQPYPTAGHVHDSYPSHVGPGKSPCSKRHLH